LFGGEGSFFKSSLARFEKKVLKISALAFDSKHRDATFSRTKDVADEHFLFGSPKFF